MMKLTVRDARTGIVYDETIELQTLVLQEQAAGRWQSLVYCDMEQIVLGLDGEGLYILDECGNWEYLDPNRFELQGTPLVPLGRVLEIVVQCADDAVDTGSDYWHGREVEAKHILRCLREEFEQAQR